MKVIGGIASDVRKPIIDIINDGCKATFASYSSNDIEFYFYFDGGAEHKVDGYDLYFPTPNTTNRVGYMTSEFFKYLIKNIKFDFLFKSSISCYVHQELLYKFLLTQPREKYFNGHILKAYFEPEKIEEKSFVTGSCSILSYDVVKFVADNADKWDHSLPEDVALSKLISLYDVPLTPYTLRQDIETAEQVMNDVDFRGAPLNFAENYCYRVKGYADPGERKIDVFIMKALHEKLGFSGIKKKNLKIYQSSNFKNNYFRYYHFFFNKLTEILKLYYNVEEDRFFEKADDEPRKISLSSGIQTEILECEIVIEDLNTKEIYVFSVCDLLSSCVIDLCKSPHTVKICLSQFNKEILDKHIPKEFQTKIIPSIYFPSTVYDFDHYYDKRTKINEKIDKLYFRSNLTWYRPILKYFDSNVLEGPECIGDFETYINDIIKYKAALSLGGKGEMCYRDIEYMALGIPFIRFEYTNQLNPSLIPNEHYISVERPEDLIKDKEGNNVHANMLQDKFIAQKTNLELLNNIAYKSREYYNNYLKYPNNALHLLRLFELI